MKIKKEVLYYINNIIDANPPESGGILGSSISGIITNTVLDKPAKSTVRHCSYSPNVEFFNQCIEDWDVEGIQFMGIFHTHFMGVETLSTSDKNYINKIMSDMPDEIDYLYFPVFVLPTRVLVPYKAKKANNLVLIERDVLEVL